MKRLLMALLLCGGCFCDNTPAAPDAGPLTCNEIQANCGIWGTPGHVIDCGTCPMTQTCSADGTCVPVTP